MDNCIRGQPSYLTPQWFTMSMLSFAQWKSKKANKLVGLPKQEIRSRYAQYQLDHTTPTTPATLTAHISPCAYDYLKALTNPFDDEWEHGLPCVPDIVSIDSTKFKTVTRGSFTIGLQGAGFVSCAPYNPCNDLPVTIFTNNLYNFDDYRYGEVGNVTANSNSPYTSAALGQGIQLRLVSCGVQASYTGAEMNRAGAVILYNDPQNKSIPNKFTVSEMLQFQRTTEVSASRDWNASLYKPSSPGALQYRDLNTLIGAGEGAANMIFVYGATPGTSWKYEFVQYWEMIGALASTTASHSDPVGMGAVLSSLPNKQPAVPPKSFFQDMILPTLKAIGKTASTVLPYVAKAFSKRGARQLSIEQSQRLLQPLKRPIITEIM